MSKAFTREDLPEAAPIVIKRAQLPEGVPNYVTPHGLELLRREREELLETRRAAIAASDHGALPNIDANLEVLESRIATAELVPPPEIPPEEARFGAKVRVLDEAEREHLFHIVGVDEADLDEQKIAFIAPLARALLGKREGDVTLVKSPRGEEEFEILSVSYEEPS